MPHRFYRQRQATLTVEGVHFLARSHRGGTANRELKWLMLGHAFRYVERVVFLVGSENRRSQRPLEKLGATCVGTRLDRAGQQSVLFELRKARLLARGIAPAAAGADHAAVVGEQKIIRALDSPARETRRKTICGPGARAPRRPRQLGPSEPLRVIGSQLLGHPQILRTPAMLRKRFAAAGRRRATRGTQTESGLARSVARRGRWGHQQPPRSQSGSDRRP